MRQIMPHRNNIAMHRTKCKMFFGSDAPETARQGGRDVDEWGAAQRFSSIGFDIVIQNNDL